MQAAKDETANSALERTRSARRSPRRWTDNSALREERVRPTITRLATLFALLLLAAPFAAEAQPAGQTHRIGALMSGSFESRRTVLEAFRQGLRDLGYTEGQNIVIEYRFTEEEERLDDLAAELVRLKVDVIVTSGITGALAAKRATTTVPIV